MSRDLVSGSQSCFQDDFISQMPDDILVMILSVLNIKDAVVTSILSTRWRFLWCSLNKLRFYSHARVFGSEKDKYINQVKSVIQRHSFPVVHEFRICFNLNSLDKGLLDEWLQFAVNKKVEFLELNFIWESSLEPDVPDRYDFPLRLVVELVSLKKLILEDVNVTEAVLQEFLTNSPHLEMISIRRPRHLNHIRVGGRPLNLKHFEIEDCSFHLKSIYISDFGLESFTYSGLQIDLRLAHLPKLKQLELDFIERPWDNMLTQIASFAPSLQSFHLFYPQYHYGPKVSAPMLDSFPKLQNVKNLKIICGHEDNCLQHLVSIANACPNLHTFAIQDPEKDLCFTHKQLDVIAGLNDSLHGQKGQISSCLSLQNLSIYIYDRRECLFLDSFPGLPYVTNLRVTPCGKKRDCLMDLASIMNACPNLETFTIKSFRTSVPITSRRKASRLTSPFERLKLVVILGYYGRSCDYELARYILRRAVALKKIVIDTRYQAGMPSETENRAARSSVKQRLIPLLPRGVELVIH